MWLIILLYGIISVYWSSLIEHMNWVRPRYCANFVSWSSIISTIQTWNFWPYYWGGIKMCTNNIKWILVRHFGCISLPRFSISLSLGRFSSMGRFVSSSYFLEESSRCDTLFLSLSGRYLTNGYGSPQRGSRQRLDSMGYSVERSLEQKRIFWLSPVSNLKVIACPTCLEIPTQRPRFPVLCDGKSDSSTL